MTRSPKSTLILNLDILPESLVLMLRPSSVSTWYMPPECTFTTVPSTFTLSSLLKSATLNANCVRLVFLSLALVRSRLVARSLNHKRSQEISFILLFCQIIFA